MRRHKFNAKPTWVGDLRFDSRMEARRWKALLLLQKAGKISNLRRQVPYVLHYDKTPLGTYYADFVYKNENGDEVVEDSKGVRTAMYKWKKKHLKAEYGIDILETGSRKNSKHDPIVYGGQTLEGIAVIATK